MPPAAAATALIPAAAGAIPGIAAAATGAGKSNARSGNFVESKAYDANRYEVGGRPGVADDMVARQRGAADHYNAAADGMIDAANNDRNASNQARGLDLEARGLSLEARNRQAEAQNLMIDRARGRNLISTQVANRARGDLTSRMASGTASARGAAGLANAQTDAMAASAQGLGQINTQEQIASMQEQQAAEQAAFGAASGMREGDSGLRAGDQATRAGDITMHGQALTSAAAMGQIGLGYTNAENTTRATQMQGNLEQQRIAAQSKQAADDLNTKTNVHNADRDMDYIKMIAGGTSGGAQTGMNMPQPGGGTPPPANGGGTPPPTSDPLAKTGIFGLGGPSAGSGPASASLDVLGPSGNLDVNSSLRAHSNVATQFAGDPTGGMAGGGLLSDPKAKAGVHPLGIDWEKRPQKSNLRDPQSFHRDTRGEQMAVRDAEYARMMREADDMIRSYKGGVDAGPAVAARDPQPPAWLSDYMIAQEGEDLTPERMQQDMRADFDARMAQGPAVSDPRAKQDAYRLGLEAGAAHATKQITGEDMQPWPKVEAEAEAEPDAPYVAPDGPSPLPPPPPAPGTGRAMQSFTRNEPTIAQQRDGAKRTLGINFHGAGRARDLRASIPASDPRAKDLGGVHSNEVAQTLDATPAVSYRYKDPSYEPEAQRPGEQQAGFLTSDLKRTPLGAAVVEKRPDGLEGYNEHRLNGLQHAEIRNLHERLRELEALIAGGGNGRK